MNFKHTFLTVFFVFKFILLAQSQISGIVYLRRILQLTKFRFIILQEALLQKPMLKVIFNFLSM